jgi:hypothetical protein
LPQAEPVCLSLRKTISSFSGKVGRKKERKKERKSIRIKIFSTIFESSPTYQFNEYYKLHGTTKRPTKIINQH